MREPDVYANGITAATHCTAPSNFQGAGLSAGDALINAIAEAVAIKLYRMGLACQQRLMDVKDAAKYLGMTDDALRHKAGVDIPCIRIDGKLRFDRRELDRWIDGAPRQGV